MLLANKIRQKRTREGISLREAAEQCGGISFSPLGRLERGDARPDLATLNRVLSWLDLAPSVLFMGAEPIRAHLRAQRHLDSPVARALAEVVSAAEQFYASSQDDRSVEAEAPSRAAGQRYRRLRSSVREDLALRFRSAVGRPPDEPIDPFTLHIQGVEIKRLDEIAGLSRETVSILSRVHARTWSAITLPANEAESVWLIVLNPTHILERRRATLMEEICHILLGHQLTAVSHLEGHTFRDYDEDQEADAYGLGAAILLPKEALRKRLNAGQTGEAIARHFGISQRLVEYRIKITGVWYQYKLLHHVTPSPSS